MATPYLSDAVSIYLSDVAAFRAEMRQRSGGDGDAESDRSALQDVLQTAAQICAEIEPSAREGWEQSARLENGEVIYPPHIQAGYDKLREAGLVSFAVSEEFDGFELPSLVANLCLQMISRADAGLMTIIGLQAGVAEDIQIYASQELKERYLPRMASGELMGAMDLTEPQAGSDLGAIVTRAEERDGRCFLTGQKIFITNGGCEIHLVLARDAENFDDSKGTTRGLSLFLCPRTLPDGSTNPVTVPRLEHKLGIHGSPTAVVEFDNAEAYRIGEKGDGFKAMLTLMNNARLGVAAQGVGISEAALDCALRYAGERKQFGVPIGEQPLMKNVLARMALTLEGSRALLYRACVLVDRNRCIEKRLASPNVPVAEQKELQELYERNAIRIRLLTPLSKYLATEGCDQLTRQAIQVHGGIGFMEESEAGKLHRDAIITTIYEGTSEIQVSFALKEIGKGALGVVFEEVGKELDAVEDPELSEYVEKLRKGMGMIMESSAALMADFSYALLSARALADVVIDVIVGSELLKQVAADKRRLDLAASWINRQMVEVEAKTQRIQEGSSARVDRAERILDLVR